MDLWNGDEGRGRNLTIFIKGKTLRKQAAFLIRGTKEQRLISEGKSRTAPGRLCETNDRDSKLDSRFHQGSQFRQRAGEGVRLMPPA